MNIVAIAVVAVCAMFAAAFAFSSGRDGAKFGAVFAMIVIVSMVALVGGGIFFFFYAGNDAVTTTATEEGEEWRRCSVSYLEGTWAHQDKGQDMVITPDFRAYFLAQDKSVTHTYDVTRREGKVTLIRPEHDGHLVLSSPTEDKLLLGQTTECEHCNKIAGRYRRALTGVELPINLGE